LSKLADVLVQETLRAATLTIDTLVCFFESGKDAGFMVLDGLTNNGKSSDFIEYTADTNFDAISFEKKIGW
jgi:hypothetical protein